MAYMSCERWSRFVVMLAALASVVTGLAPAGSADPSAPPVSPAVHSEKGAGSVAVPEPSEYRTDDYRKPVPLTLRGARVLTTAEAADIWNADGALFIDVYPQAPKPANLPAGTIWRDPKHRTIENAKWLPNVGYGGLSPELTEYFRSRLTALLQESPDRPVVIFCLRDCWMSWNSAKRAIELGFKNVMWFRDGTDGWQELGYPLVEVKPEP